jgi:hypothetical protein
VILSRYGRHPQDKIQASQKALYIDENLRARDKEDVVFLINISKNNNALAYLYSAGYSRNIKDAKTKRCRQISTEFYKMAGSLL